MPGSWKPDQATPPGKPLPPAACREPGRTAERGEGESGRWHKGQESAVSNVPFTCYESNLLGRMVAMIHKDSDPVVAPNKYGQAGRDAERQMAFYLRRAFADSADVHVINDLRLTRNGETAQIDHLIVHKCGFFIIESKSSHGVIHVNANREFSRVFGRKKTGMRSPIEQARLQGELLRALLQDHRESLRGKFFAGLRQGGFLGCHIQVIAAVSDTGRIEGDRKVAPELLKADLVVELLREHVERHRRAASLAATLIDSMRGKDFDKGWGGWWFDEGELPKTVKFLLEHHQPRAASVVLPAGPTAQPTRPASPSAPKSTSPPKAPRPTPDPATATATAPNRNPIPTYICTKCQSTNLDLLFARSYYFKCRDCGGNTAIKNVCRACNQLTRTSKRRSEYFSVCDTCKTETLFFKV